MDHTTMLGQSRAMIDGTRADISRKRDATADLTKISAASRQTVIATQESVRLLIKLERL